MTSEQVDPLQEYKYDFEKEAHWRQKINDMLGLRKAPRIATQVEQFCHRLGIPYDIENKKPNLSDNQNRLIRSFIVSTVSNIDWYGDAIWRKTIIRNFYIALSVGLLIGIPFAIQEFAPETDTETVISGIGTFASQFGAFLAVILALHKVFGQLIRETARFGKFWKAQAGLKEILYGLESSSSGAAIAMKEKDAVPSESSSDNSNKAALKPEFETSLAAATAKANEIVRQETEDYFDSLSVPDLNIAQTLSSSKESARSLLGAFKPRRVAEAEARAAKLRSETEEQDKLDTEIVSLKAEIEALSDLLQTYRNDATNALGDDKKRVEAEIARLATEKQQKESSLVIATATRAALD